MAEILEGRIVRGMLLTRIMTDCCTGLYWARARREGDAEWVWAGRVVCSRVRDAVIASDVWDTRGQCGSSWAGSVAWVGSVPAGFTAVG